MNAITIAAKEQITLRKELLQHLGVHPGDKISIEMLPGGRIAEENPSGGMIVPEARVGRISRIETGEPQFGTNQGLYCINRLSMRLYP